MRLLMDVLGPAHAHLFGALGRELGSRGHEVHYLVEDDPVALGILSEHGLDERVVPRERGAFQRGFLHHSWRLWRALERARPDVVLAVLDSRTSLAPWLGERLAGRRPRLVLLRDDERKNLAGRGVEWFAHEVVTPDSYSLPVRGTHVTYAGYQALAYLHPQRFTPNVNVVRDVGLDPDARYFVLRVLPGNRSRDYLRPGLTISQRIMLARVLGRSGRVVVTADGPLPPELEKLRVKCPGSSIHHVLAHARLLVGESATMTAEAAVLGVPAVYIAHANRGYTDELERQYELVQNFNGPRFIADWMSTVRRLAPDDGLRARAEAARVRLLAEKTDVTAFLAEHLERQVAACGRG
jgi:predicted glycosyltransferase